jgi:hypothetical protein
MHLDSTKIFSWYIFFVFLNLGYHIVFKLSHPVKKKQKVNKQIMAGYDCRVDSLQDESIYDAFNRAASSSWLLPLVFKKGEVPTLQDLCLARLVRKNSYKKLPETILKKHGMNTKLFSSSPLLQIPTYFNSLFYFKISIYVPHILVGNGHHPYEMEERQQQYSQTVNITHKSPFGPLKAVIVQTVCKTMWNFEDKYTVTVVAPIPLTPKQLLRLLNKVWNQGLIKKYLYDGICAEKLQKGKLQCYIKLGTKFQLGFDPLCNESLMVRYAPKFLPRASRSTRGNVLVVVGVTRLKFLL